MVNNINYEYLDTAIQQATLYNSRSGKFKIISYENAKNVRIKFVKTGYETVGGLGNIRKGVIKDRMLPSVFGVGFMGGKYKSKINGKHTKEYILWRSMLQRCYDEKFIKDFPTYTKAVTSENFNNYDWFYEWCNKQIGFGLEGFELDKDLLVKGSKVYSEDTCVFLPKEINNVLIKRDNDRGNYLLGVDFSKATGEFRSRLNIHGKSTHLGYYKTELEAFNAYKIAKENYIKELAEKYKHQIDQRAYNALINYQVEITD